MSSGQGWLPVYLDEDQRFGVMSLAFLLPNSDSAVIWRGPKKTCTFPYVSVRYLSSNSDDQPVRWKCSLGRS